MNNQIMALTIAAISVFPASAGNTSDGTSSKLSVNLEGYMSYSTKRPFVPGLFSLSGEHPEVLWQDSNALSVGFPMTTGWLNDGKITGFILYSVFGQLQAYYYVTLDHSTGDCISSEEINPDNGMFSCAAFNPETQMIYGYGYNSEGKLAFMSAPVSNPSSTVTIRVASGNPAPDFCPSITYNPVNKCLYGINMAGYFVRIDTEGKQKRLVELPQELMPQGYITGLTYSPSDNRYYWNANYGDGKSGLFAFSLEDRSVEKIFDYGQCEQFGFMICPDEVMDPDSPAAPKSLSVDFPNGSLQGSISFVLPERLNGGGSIDGKLDWQVCSEGSILESGSGLPGATVEFKTTLSEGMHTIEAMASLGEKTGYSAKIEKFFGCDVPSKPTDVNLSLSNVSWTPVTEGEHGGYIDIDNIEYLVKQDGKMCDTVHNTTMSLTLPDSGPLRSYCVEVQARYGDKTGPWAISNSITVGEPLSVPFTIQPTEEQAALMMTVDSNSDDVCWTFQNYPELHGSATFYSGSGIVSALDDWLITPPVKIPESTAPIFVTLQAGGSSQLSINEIFEVMAGFAPDPEDMNLTVCENLNPLPLQWTTYGGKLPAEAGGKTIYVGIHAITPAHELGFLVKNISVTPNDPMGSSDEIESGSISVRDTTGGIVITAPQGSNYSIFSVTGTVEKYGSLTSGTAVINMTSGIYIVKVNNKTFKILVK